MTNSRLGPGAEFDLIRKFLGDAGGGADGGTSAVQVGPDGSPSGVQVGPDGGPSGVQVGPGDDCAVVSGDLAISVDMTIEGVHFLKEWLTPEEIGYRAVAAALSDLAAMAAAPVGVLVALALRLEDAHELGPRVMAGARAAAAGVKAVLLGGDSTRSPGPMVIDVVVVGNTARPLLRSGARPGDTLWVTGELGAAAAAVRSWQRGLEPEPAARLAFALPAPRIEEAIWLARHGVIAALLDISDGLAGDAGHIAAASDVQIVLDAESIPIHPAVYASSADAADALRLALAGGEDYELCFAARPGAVEPLAAQFSEAFGLQLTCVGAVQAGIGVLLRDGSGRLHDLPATGFDHFGGAAG
jgi:thiamine-monophosphate kinase